MSAGAADAVERSGSMRIVVMVAGTMLATVLVVIGALSLLDRAPAEPKSNLIGHKISSFTILPGVNGAAVRPPWLHHHPAVLLFFASWCTPCRAELPSLARSFGTGRIGPAVLVGIDGDHSPSAALSFVTSSGVRFIVAQDANLVVASALIGAFPSTVFVTSHGTVAAVHYGVISAAQLREGAAALH